MELGRWRGLPGGGSRALAWAEEAEGVGRRHHAQHLCMVLGFSLVGGAWSVSLRQSRVPGRQGRASPGYRLPRAQREGQHTGLQAAAGRCLPPSTSVSSSMERVGGGCSRSFDTSERRAVVCSLKSRSGFQTPPALTAPSSQGRAGLRLCRFCTGCPWDGVCSPEGSQELRVGRCQGPGKTRAVVYPRTLTSCPFFSPALGSTGSRGLFTTVLVLLSARGLLLYFMHEIHVVSWQGWGAP